ncbi:MAG: hypothetical protein J6X18_02195 [Bacteroidales bacterium]|nr:hypothetical protein [Bacteroidales bacterium]
MKKILFLCLIALGLMFSSCTKQRDSYYVKYEVVVSNPPYNAPPSANIELLTSDTIVSKSITGSFMEVYGPYKYHDRTYLKISCNNGHYSWNTVSAYGKIYVSKNEEPVVLKQEISTALSGSSDHDTCEISYIIDF